MQSTDLPPSSTSKTTTSIFDAIKNSDWEGLLALYATSSYDAVHSANFACQHRSSLSTVPTIIRQHPLTHSLISADRSIRRGGEEKNLERALSSFHDKSQVLSPSHSIVRELDIVVRKILGSCDEAGQAGVNHTQEQNKKTSPSKLASSALEHILHHSSFQSANQREVHLEKVIWESAKSVSNSSPHQAFVVHRSVRTCREEDLNARHCGAEEMDLDSSSGGTVQKTIERKENTPLFEGNIANATPGEFHDGGTGAGTAQHLACLLDSPFALAILILLGADVESRHTAFRRLSIHEAACADSPQCLRLLMEIGTRFPSDAASSLEDGDLEMSGKGPSCKKKLNLFSASWNKGKTHVKRSFHDVGKNLYNTVSFPSALEIMWEAVQYLRLGEMDEMSAAHYLLDRISLSNKSMTRLTLQCPLIDPAAVSPFTSIPGYAAMNHIFQPTRDNQISCIRRNVDGHGNTPLHWASFKNSVRALDVLLSYNVDVNSRAQPSGWTPLHDAAYSNAADAVARLIAAGAFVDAKSHSGATPLCFSAQEDAPNATRILLQAGADPSIRCLGPGMRVNNADNNQIQSRFSGYTPLHYCAHYNAARAARLLLYDRGHHSRHLSTVELLEIPDVQLKLPIHIAVARGASEVLRELLHAGARLETTFYHPSSPPSARSIVSPSTPTAPLAIPSLDGVMSDGIITSSVMSTSPTSVISPVSSPILKAMLPSQPVTSSKPWNCLSQQSIDKCKHLIEEVEMSWTPERHSLFSPVDRDAIVEVLRIGKRLEQKGRGIYLDLWPHILAFLGRGWFEVEQAPLASMLPPRESEVEEEITLSNSDEHMEQDEEDAIQFHLEGVSGHLAAIL